MSTPGPAHIDAETTIETLTLSLWDEGLVHPEHHGRAVIEHLLTECVDVILDGIPDAAMLDALTRHGVLTEEAHRRCTGCGATDSRDVPFILSHFMHDMDVTTEDAPEVVERRLVTSWEVTP